MTKLATLQDGLLDELKDLFSAENQLLKAIPKMMKKSTNQRLKDAFNSHLLETEGQVERLNEIAKILQEKLSGKTCKAMQGLIAEGKEVLEEESQNKALLDALIIGAAQRVEHYEIAAYGTARAMAQELNQDEIANLLEETLEEEKETDKRLSSIAEEEVLSEANTPDEENMGKPRARVPGAPSGKGLGSSSRALGLLGCLVLLSQTGPAALADTGTSVTQNEKAASDYEADNTGRNVRDRNEARVTADDQALGGGALAIEARIRRELIANKDLSMNGHNVKIIVENGQVVLRGPVDSMREKAWIQETTSRIAAGYKVINQLEIAAS